jgi:hypothetical protein
MGRRRKSSAGGRRRSSDSGMAYLDRAESGLSDRDYCNTTSKTREPGGKRLGKLGVCISLLLLTMPLALVVVIKARRGQIADLVPFQVPTQRPQMPVGASSASTLLAEMRNTAYGAIDTSTNTEHSSWGDRYQQHASESKQEREALEQFGVSANYQGQLVVQDNCSG